MVPKPSEPPRKDSKIAIVGAGVFGLSTALHLSRRGYTNIHIFDRQPYSQNAYACSEGADAASADENKIIRASYGGAKLYQDLAFKAMPEWEAWNRLLATTPAEELPTGLSPQDRLWDNCGFLRISDQGFDNEERATQKNFPPELKHTQYRISDPQRREDALENGIPASKLDPFDRLSKNLSTDGILDTTAGYALASRACAFALHLCQKANINLNLGPDHALASLSYSPTGTTVTGLTTASKTHHTCSHLILATGGWTPTLLPTTSSLLEATSGSILSFRLPSSRLDLWSKFSPANFPVWSFNMPSYTVPGTSIGGIYGLPRTPEGVVKIAFRGAKFPSYASTHTNPTTGSALSHPRTDEDRVPAEAMRVLRTFAAENVPELLELEFEKARLCWYTDSVDNNWLISYVPQVSNLVVASGGSGHGFKFLPVLGEHVADVFEGRETEYTRLFAWRGVPEGERNGLEEGPGGWRALEKQRMVGKRAWKTGSAL